MDFNKSYSVDTKVRTESFSILRVYTLTTWAILGLTGISVFLFAMLSAIPPA